MTLNWTVFRFLKLFSNAPMKFIKEIQFVIFRYFRKCSKLQSFIVFNVDVCICYS